ncbi:hypothetical protein HDU93_009593 [Gonapodya sp. JEL0774]|nr:hypothetical protein HDU93_009593 [Gonapodya sp. JEL0774]
MSKKYDVVVWGATGYTGSYVAEYLAESGPKDLKWALAGRSLSKVQDTRAAILARLSELYPARLAEGDQAFNGIKAKDILVADSGDQASIDAMVAQTKVVIACAGPFSRYGTPVVSACARLGADYVDITGESKWILDMTRDYADKAKETGAIIVPSCGFDSVPSDLLTHLLALQLRSHSLLTATVRNSCTDFVAGASGGTLLTSAEGVEALVSGKKDGAERKKPFRLEKGPPTPRGGKLPKAGSVPLYWDKDLGKWQGIWVMARVNASCIRRSQWLLNWRYGNFLYTETRGFKSFFSALFANLSLVTFGILFAFGPTRRLLQRFVLPAPGSGTVKDSERRSNYYVMEGVAVSEVGEDGKQKTVKGTWEGQGDPGYWHTCIMVAEAALCCIYERDSLPGAKEFHGGVLSPASAFGTVLVERLKRTGTVKINVSNPEIVD